MSGQAALEALTQAGFVALFLLTLVTGWDYLTAGVRHATGPAANQPGVAAKRP